MDSGFNRLHLMPTAIELAGAEIELVSVEHREMLLKNALAEVRERYDYIFIDCPPSLSLLTLNALSAADSVLIPIQCEYYALEGVGQLVNTIKLMRKKLNPQLEVEGILLTMYDARTNLCAQVVQGGTHAFQRRGICDHDTAQCALERSAQLWTADSSV